MAKVVRPVDIDVHKALENRVTNLETVLRNVMLHLDSDLPPNTVRNWSSKWPIG